MDSRLSLSKLEKDIYMALKLWHKAGGTASPFEALCVFDHTMQTDANNARAATNKILLYLMSVLEETYQEGAELLSRRFFDGEKMRIIANSLNMSPATAYRKQEEAIEQLARILQARELEIRHRQQVLLEQRLERPTYTHLIGFDSHLNRLVQVLAQAESPWLVSIEGMGGIGKTSLAHAICRQIIRQRNFDDVGWVSARSQIFKLSGQIKAVDKPALTTESLIDQLLAQLRPNLPKPETLSFEEAQRLLQDRLQQARHLIVIDNLETVQDVEELLPTLSQLANPAKFLLTSRESFYDEAAIYHFPLPELSETDALCLIRHEIEQHNLTHLQQASEADLKKIVRTVGGNPLALRLVVGQTHIFALNVILEDLAQARSQTVEELYIYIYRRAWEALDEPARELFLTMPLLTDEGECIEDLAELSGMAAGLAHTALKHLVDLNLVNSSGDHQARHYSIHNLTRTFLQEQVLKWT